QSWLASMRAQGSSSSRLTYGTISSPPGTGSSCGQSEVKPRWASTTRRPLEDRRIDSIVRSIRQTAKTPRAPRKTRGGKRQGTILSLLPILALLASWRFTLFSIRLRESHPPLRRLAGEHVLARLLRPVEGDAADGGLGLGGDAVFRLARAVPVRQQKAARLL